jgi:hypothetical protein
MQLWTTSLLVYEQNTSPAAASQRVSPCSKTRPDQGIQPCLEIAFASSSLVIEDRPGMSAFLACSYNSALVGSSDPASDADPEPNPEPERDPDPDRERPT